MLTGGVLLLVDRAGGVVVPWQHYPTPAGPPPPGPPPPPPPPDSPFNLQLHGKCHYDYIRTVQQKTCIF